MSDSVRPHRRQPTRASPGKNTGVGCHVLLQCMKVKSESEVAQSCLTLRDPMDCSPRGSSVHAIFQARVLEWGAIAFSRNHLKPVQSQKVGCLEFCGLQRNRLLQPKLGPRGWREENSHLSEDFVGALPCFSQFSYLNVKKPTFKQ